MTDLTELNRQWEEWKREKMEEENKARSTQTNAAPVESDTWTWTLEEFSIKYGESLQLFLQNTLHGERYHLEDLAAHASIFGEAFYAISGRFM